MPLHPQAQAYLEQLAQQPPPGWDELTAPQAREVFETFQSLTGPAPQLARVEDHTVPEGVAIRLYCDRSDPAPAAMYFHGGGWVLGDLDSHDSLCRRLAQDSGCAVIAVDYGRSPENRFPGPIEDCYRATQFVTENAASLDVNASRLAVVGDSAGGHLATSVALQARDRARSTDDRSPASAPRIDLQVLLYPVIEPNFETESYRRFAEGFGLTRAGMQWFWRHFLGSDDPVGSAPPEAVPSRAREHAGLPPAIVVTAEYDVLRDEGVAYAQQLQRAGVEVDHWPCEGVIHGFLHLAGAFDDGVRVTSEIARELGRRLEA